MLIGPDLGSADGDGCLQVVVFSNNLSHSNLVFPFIGRTSQHATTSKLSKSGNEGLKDPYDVVLTIMVLKSLSFPEGYSNISDEDGSRSRQSCKDACDDVAFLHHITYRHSCMYRRAVTVLADSHLAATAYVWSRASNSTNKIPQLS